MVARRPLAAIGGTPSELPDGDPLVVADAENPGEAATLGQLATVPWTAPYWEDLDDAPLGWVAYNESLATNPPPIGNGVVQTFVSGELRYQTAYGGDTGHVASRLSWMGTWGTWKVVYSGHESWDDVEDKPSTFPPATHDHDDRYFTEAEVTSALSGKQDTSQKNQANGYAGLDSGGKVAAAQLPSYSTDEVTEGSTNKYYTAARARGDVIASSITNGDTTHSPSGDAVFDALAGKAAVGGSATGVWLGNTAGLPGTGTVGVVYFTTD